jgi:hypothetical protein
MEGADLTSAVREKLESSNGAGLDLVYVFRRLGLPENLAVPAIPEIAPERSSTILGAQLARRWIADRVRIHFVQHGTSKKNINWINVASDL